MTGILLTAGLAALGVSLALTPVFRSLALRYGIGDAPGLRKVHEGFIPRLGGGGIIGGFAAGLAVAWLMEPFLFRFPGFSLAGVGAGFLIIIAAGVLDDIFNLGFLTKLLMQSAAAVAAVAAGLRIEHLAVPFLGTIALGWVGIPLTMLWLVGVTNAVNLLDGLDGLAGGVSALVAAAMLCVGFHYGDALLITGSTALLFACAGFLRYNFHPASVFMGDTGSLFLGFLLASLSLRLLQHQAADATPLSLLVAVVILGVPVVDTTVAFFRRLTRGAHPMRPDKEHIHHRLMDLGLTHRQTVAAIWAISAFNGVVALFLVLLDSLYGAVLLAVVLAATVFSLHRLGYVEEMRLKRGDGRPPIQPLSVARILDRLVLAGGDILAVVLGFVFSWWFRFHSGLVAHGGFVPFETYITSPVILLMIVYWLVLFLMAGLYEIPWDLSRIDYGLRILKSAAIGTLGLFVLTLDFSGVTLEGRLTTLVYGASVASAVLFLRMVIVALERRYEVLGFRRRNTLVVGTTEAAAELVREIRERPGLKYRVVGFVAPHEKVFMDMPVLGDTCDLPRLVREYNVEEILVAADYKDREEILEVAAQCNGMVSSVKVVPGDVEVLSGFKTEEILGHPLIRLYPVNLKAWQRAAKRLTDIAVSLLVLVPFLPLWLLAAAAIRMDTAGSIFFTQERVGKKGRPFRLIKFRSMVTDAERDTGPVWARPGDIRITRTGLILRRFRLDEVPQFLNVLKGEMSLVGPRPERPYFVDQLKKDVGFYTRRLLVRPGITGWAQIKLHYDRSVEDVRKKIQYDLYYLENMSLTLDFKIMARTLLVALSGKGTH
ncbi:MAG: exopolysaccharide biosynthesis polyprenyl glycosylphosphotransferase [Bacteroidota bacterium]